MADSAPFDFKDTDLIGKYNEHIYVIEAYPFGARAFILSKHRGLLFTMRHKKAYDAERWAQNYINTRQLKVEKKERIGIL